MPNKVDGERDCNGYALGSSCGCESSADCPASRGISRTPVPNKVEEFRQALELAERLKSGNYPLQPRGQMFLLIEKARAFLDEYDSLNL